jgi:L-iditol 2-dehydrogenase
MTATMRGVMLRGRRNVEVVEVPVPTPKPGEVVLRVDAALTCGTDAKVFRRGYHARMLTPPCLFGHEYSGTIAAVGAGVTSFGEGDPVIGANSSPCGHCVPCSRGREALCDHLEFVNGAFAQWLRLPARLVAKNLYRRPAGLDPVLAAATEPLACVLKGVEVSGAQPGESVLLIGAGPVALFFVAALKAQGIESIVFARRPEAIVPAAAMGAVKTIVAPCLGDAEDQLLELSPGARGFDLVVEAAGAEETSDRAPELCAKGGRVLLFGGCSTAARVNWSPARLHYDEVAVLSSFHHTPRHVAAAIDVLSSAAVPVAPILEAPVGLAGVEHALTEMCARTIRGKVPVIPG